MIAHFDNLVNSSLQLYIDNIICRVGQAYTSISGSKLYHYPKSFNGYSIYALPYSQIISDSSISGPSVMTGLFLNNNFIVKGQSGFVDFNYEKGQAYFSTGLPSNAVLSGNFAIKEFGVDTTKTPESTLLFETKFVPRPKINQTITGLKDDELAYPAIYIKQKTKKIEAVQFGGGNRCNENKFSIYIFADSQFSCDAAAGIIHDAKESYFGLLSANEGPFNVLGGLKTGKYDYLSMSTPKIQNNSGVYIKECRDASFHGIVRSELTALNPNVYTRVIDISTEYYRDPEI